MGAANESPVSQTHVCQAYYYVYIWQRPINMLAFSKEITYGQKSTIWALQLALNYQIRTCQKKLYHVGSIRVYLKGPKGPSGPLSYSFKPILDIDGDRNVYIRTFVDQKLTVGVLDRPRSDFVFQNYVELCWVKTIVIYSKSKGFGQSFFGPNYVGTKKSSDLSLINGCENNLGIEGELWSGLGSLYFSMG